MMGGRLLAAERVDRRFFATATGERERSVRRTSNTICLPQLRMFGPIH